MKRIKQLREARKISQERLAIELSVTQAIINEYELGILEPDISMIRKLANYFGVSANYLLEISDDKMPLTSTGLSEAEKEILFGFKRLDNFQKEKLKAYLQGLLQKWHGERLSKQQKII